VRDVVYILLTLGFFALAYAYIAGCARVLGPDATPEIVAVLVAVYLVVALLLPERL